MSGYKSLSRFEKFESIKEGSWSRSERHEVAKYLKALWINDQTTLDIFESFGDEPYCFILNKRTYERQLLFGIDKKEFDEYGWLIKCDLTFQEVIDLGLGNSIEIASGHANETHTYGWHLQTSTSGSCCGACVWMEILPSRDLAIQKALEYAIHWHTREDWKESPKVIKKASEMLDKLKGQGQLSLF